MRGRAPRSAARAVLLGAFWLIQGPADHTPGARGALAAYESGVRALRAGDARSALASLETAAAAFPRDPSLLYALARAEARVGDRGRAVEVLGRVVRFGFGAGLANEPDFTPLRADPRFQALLPAAAANGRPIAGSLPAFTIPEPDLIPEGIAVDARSGTLYVGSLHKHKIVAVSDGGVRDLVTDGTQGLGEVLGLKVDPAGRSLWVCSAEGDAVGGNPKRRSALYRFALPGGAFERSWPAPGAGAHLLNDLALTRSGDAFLTDSEDGSVLRLRAGADALEHFTAEGRFAYPNGIALSRDDRLLYVADLGGITVFDLPTGVERPLDAPEDVTLAGIDGLSVANGNLVAVQNGVDPPRIVVFWLAADGRRVLGAEVLERGNPLFDDPTTGAVAGSWYLYLANTQLSALAPGNMIRDPEQRRPVRILKIELPAARQRPLS